MKNLKGEMKKGGGKNFFLRDFTLGKLYLSFFSFFFLLFEDQTRRTVYFIPNEFERSVFSSSLSSSSTIWRGLTCNNFFLSNDGGGKRRRRSKIILLTFHASFPPITTPHSFSRKREIDLETSQRVKLLCFAILRGVV